MIQRKWIRGVGAFACAALVVAGSVAEAGWRHRHGSSGGSSGGSWGSSGGSSGGSYGSSGGSYGSSGGSYGSSGGSYGSSGGSYGSSGGSYGSSGGSSGGYGWHGRWHARHHHSHGSSGGSYSSYGSSGGSHGSSGGSYGSYGSHGGSYSSSYHGGSAGSYGGTVSHGYSTSEQVISDRPVTVEGGESYRVIDDKPAAGGETIKTPAPTTGGDKTSFRLPADAGMLVVQIPAAGKVFINGSETSAKGSIRRFVSRGLAAGEKYDFSVRMVVDRDGKPVEQVRTVRLAVGEQRTVSFDEVAKAAETRTSLTLRVPAGAKVFLAGRETAATGEVRRFETRTLAAGERWKGYEIRVVTLEGGREKVSRKVIDLLGGDELDLNLGGDAAPVEGVAAAR